MQFKFFKLKRNLKKENLEINPVLYWRIILCITVVLISASFVFGFLSFIKINKDIIVSISDNNRKVESIDKNRVKNILEYFKNREKKSNEILNSNSSVVDPSL